MGLAPHNEAHVLGGEALSEHVILLPLNFLLARHLQLPGEGVDTSLSLQLLVSVQLRLESRDLSAQLVTLIARKSSGRLRLN